MLSLNYIVLIKKFRAMNFANRRNYKKNKETIFKKTIKYLRQPLSNSRAQNIDDIVDSQNGLGRFGSGEGSKKE